MAARSADDIGPWAQAISIIVPALNEAGGLAAFLDHLQPLRAAGCELLLVDGGSSDDTRTLAKDRVDRVVIADRGRALQMNAGAYAARGEVLLFLHADTRLSAEATTALGSLGLHDKRCWGRFDVEFDGTHPLLRVVATAMNLRSRLTGIATGDQAMFVLARVFEEVGGFPPQPLMEDIELSARLRARCRPLCLKARVRTSARRWVRNGVLRTILMMWRLRLCYFLGVPAERLHRIWMRS